MGERESYAVITGEGGVPIPEVWLNGVRYVREDTPGPATEAMLDRLQEMPKWWGEVDDADRRQVLGTLTVGDVVAFLRERGRLATPAPAPGPATDGHRCPIVWPCNADSVSWDCAECGRHWSVTAPAPCTPPDDAG